MSNLIDLYSEVSSRVTEINGQIQQAEQEIAQLSTAYSGDTSVRISKLEEQIKKIDEYILKIKGFQELAKKNLDSLNVLTIEAPPGYRVNLNRLRNWAMMIDPTSSNDPYAQRVYIVSKCDEFFLENKKNEFTARIAELKAELENGSNDEVDGLNNKINGLKEALKQYALSEDITELAKAAVAENKRRWYRTSPKEFKNSGSVPAVISPGAFAADLNFDTEQRNWLKTVMGEFYDADGGRVLIPVDISNNSQYVMTVTCPPSRRKKLDKALQSLVLATVNENPAGSRKVYVLDGIRFNSSSMGTLRSLEGSFAMEQIPRNPEQLTSTLEQIVSSFADADEVLEMYDSVVEYNAVAEEGKKLPLSTVIIFGWPNAFEGHDRELVQKIMTNYERHGISFIAVRYDNAEKHGEASGNAMPEYAMQNAIHINMLQNETTITFAEGKPQRFVWYTFADSLTDEYADSVLKHRVASNIIGSEYVKRIDMENFAPYERGKKSISLPYGIDTKDEMHSISFDNENFAAYLMGASGSGKSTLLHTLITGIIKNYHPDDVELWLADFKMSEFAQYIDPLPPHVKYILLDESPELVFDLIDRLTEKMMERQRFFMRHRDMKKVENVPSDVYMPVIFVILDEFSIMSQAVAESESYKLKLQNLLAKGRALGIKFIFSSQTFTKGVAGLTQTAKDQIQTRIAMKNSYNEINETLELSSGTRTEQVKNWMEALPPHYTLIKYREGDRLSVKKMQVMYFKGKGDEALEPQRRLIRHLNSTMRKISIDEYNNRSIDTYVDKQPVIVDGNSYKAFNEKAVSGLIAEYKEANRADLSPDDTVITFGSPRRMTNTKFSVISNESRENLLLVARGAEQACEMSLILTAIKSFTMQGGKVSIWAYGKNRIFKAYKDSHFAEYDIKEGMTAICGAISDVRESILQNKPGKELIVMVGMEQICSDFDLMDFNGIHSSGAANINAAEYTAKTDEEIAQVNEVADIERRFQERFDIDALEEKWIDEGKSFEEIAAEEEKLYRKFAAENGISMPEGNGSSEEKKAQPANEKAVDKTVEKTDGKAYNASEDFKYTVKQGSRLGYHFMLCLNDLSDLRMLALQQELFKHKLVFQLSADDSVTLFASRVASRLPEHICQYSDTLEQYSLRPYIHDGVTWDGWELDENGNAVNTVIV